jgi:hypothetical protein
MIEKRTSESIMALAIVRFLRRTPDKRATIGEIVEALPRWSRLTKADRERSPSRPSEHRWEQTVRNVRSHNAGRKYGLRAIEGGFALDARPAAHAVARLREMAREASR